MPPPSESEAKVEPFCTGRCSTTCVFLCFIYAAFVYMFSYLAVRAPTFALPFFSAVPNIVALLIFWKVFGERVSYKQVFSWGMLICWLRSNHLPASKFMGHGVFVFLSTLALSLPLLFCLPLLRHGWMMVVGLLDVAATAANVFSLLRPGFLLWALLDAFLLRACIQEALKYGICFQLREQQKVFNIRNLVFYAVLAATTFSLVTTTSDSVRLAFHTTRGADVAQSVAIKLMWGRQVEVIPQEALRAVAATTALCHFVSTIVMMGSLLIAVIACRRAYLGAVAVNRCAPYGVEQPPRFLFSIKDFLQKDSEEGEATAHLLAKEVEDQA
ncbi:transmembrane protein [Cyclospora cayetanensis]|uniref:Transmembrane protein n=1 Tax=Cyclospora cayetanensis TaxID=88456 RepID=A0A1D3D6B8_9EIME|nr:transmembrane protein [Cyclospora cayetanensis]